MVIEQLNISSNLNNIHEVESLVDRICSSLSFSDEVYGDVLISITEAFNNAVMHGNKFDLNKPVNISVSKSDSSLNFSISDEGDGFDYNHIPDPTAPENLEKECGRGIFLIRNLADEVSFNTKGNEISIIFHFKS